MDFSKLERLKYFGQWPRTLLDVGANVGTFSKDFCTFFSGCVPVLIEPNPHCKPLLQQLGYEYHLIAASSRTAREKFHLTKVDLMSTGASLYRENTEFFSDEKVFTIDVDLVALDELFSDRTFDFIKIDVQGAELDVIRGAEKLLRRSEHVLVELSLVQYNEGSPLADVVISAMSEFNFRLDSIIEYHRFKNGTLFQIDILFSPIYPRHGQRALYAGSRNRSDLVSFFSAERRRDPGFTILDIGASANPWSQEIIDATFDKFPSNIAKYSFSGDFNKESDWNPLLEHVARHGKFRYSICSHVLEDLAYPAVALKYLPLISDAGFISMPSTAMELQRLEGPYREFIHHRWIVSVLPSGRIRFNPKISLIEHLEHNAHLPPGKFFELRIFWQRAIDYEFLNDNYLGPNPSAVLQMYQDLLANGA